MLEIAKKAVLAAAEISYNKFGSLHNESYKSGEEIVTEADFESEKIIKSVICEKFPDHSILGEEEGRNGSSNEYIWIIDPIDGTVNYSRSMYHYGISLALAQEKNVILGVVYNPLTKELFAAEKGKGAFLNDKPIHVSNRSEMFKAVIYSTELYKTKDLIYPLFDKVKNLRITSSSAYETCLVACGRTEAFIKITSHPWGFAAANLIVEEAGGKVSNFYGSSWDIDSTGLLSSNGLLHDQILELITQ